MHAPEELGVVAQQRLHLQLRLHHQHRLKAPQDGRHLRAELRLDARRVQAAAHSARAEERRRDGGPVHVRLPQQHAHLHHLLHHRAQRGRAPAHQGESRRAGSSLLAPLAEAVVPRHERRERLHAVGPREVARRAVEVSGEGDELGGDARDLAVRGEGPDEEVEEGWGVVWGCWLGWLVGLGWVLGLKLCVYMSGWARNVGRFGASLSLRAGRSTHSRCWRPARGASGAAWPPRRPPWAGC